MRPLALVLALACGGPTDAPTGPLLVRREAVRMGTLWTFTVRTDAGREADARAALAGAEAEVARLEALLSERLPDSDVSRVNAGAGGPPVGVAPEVSALLGRALDLCARTGRRMDPTFLPLGRLWDPERVPFVVPGDAEVAGARDLVDCTRVEVDAALSTVRLPRAGMGLGVGAFAKGYAVDRAAAVVVAAGFPDVLVDGGGDVLALGTRGDGPWRVGIRNPGAPAGTLVAVARVTNRAVATSGASERFAKAEGRRYGHVIDPATGRPAGGLASATAIAPDAETADGLATALLVAGETRVSAILAAFPASDALLVRPDGTTWATPAALALLDDAPDPSPTHFP